EALSGYFQFASLAFVASLIAVVINTLIPFKIDLEQIKGEKYFDRYAFSNCFSGVKLLGYELAHLISPLITHSIHPRAIDNQLHTLFKARFQELDKYLKRLVRNQDGSQASLQVEVLGSILEQL